MENKIIDTARIVFIEKGYAETSMSEIAARVGINRPALHYYFRTKDKMFQAVFGSIVSSVIPKVFEALTHREKSIAQRVGGIIDAYYTLFLENPRLPMFMLRELNRDPDLLIKTIQQLNVMDNSKRCRCKSPSTIFIVCSPSHSLQMIFQQRSSKMMTKISL